MAFRTSRLPPKVRVDISGGCLRGNPLAVNLNSEFLGFVEASPWITQAQCRWFQPPASSEPKID